MGVIIKKATLETVGEIKHTCSKCKAVKIDEVRENPPITKTKIETLSNSYKFNITCITNFILNNEIVIVAAYDDGGKLVALTTDNFNGKKNVNIIMEKNIEIKFIKIFVWDITLSPIAREEVINIT